MYNQLKEEKSDWKSNQDVIDFNFNNINGTQNGYINLITVEDL